MISIFDSELPKKKTVFFALQKIYGIGKSHANLICKKLGFSSNLKIKNLLKDQIIDLEQSIEELNTSVGLDLKNIKYLALKKLVDIKSYRGLRKLQGLPVRGQRTHTNAKTARRR